MEEIKGIVENKNESVNENQDMNYNMNESEKSNKSESIDNNDNDTDGSITFMPIVMNEEVFSLGVKALYGDITKGMVMDVILFDIATKRKLLSQSFICLDKNEIVGALKNNIPSKKTGYLVSVKVLSTNKSVLLSGSKEYTIEDETGLMNLEVYNPTLKLNDNKILVANDSLIEGDYLNKNNATYVTQGQTRVLDLFLPVEVNLRASNEYKINKIYDYKLTMTDSNQNTYMHCGNKKFNSVIVKNDGSGAFIRFNEEWKNHIECNSYNQAQAEFVLNLWVSAELEYIGENKDIEGIRKVSWSTETIADKIFSPVIMSWCDDE